MCILYCGIAVNWRFENVTQVAHIFEVASHIQTRKQVAKNEGIDSKMSKLIILNDNPLHVD